MKKMDRYVIVSMIVPLLIGTLSVTLMFHLNLIIEVYRKYGTEVMNPSAMLQLVYYKTPYFLGQTLPIGVALASSLTVARFARESELTAIRSAGVSISRFIVPILVIGILIGVSNWSFIEYVQPPSEVKAAALYNKYNLAASHNFKPDVVLGIKQYLASFSQVSLQGNGDVSLNDAVLIERIEPNSMRVITAAKGLYRKGIWYLENPLDRMMRGDKLVSIKGLPKFQINEQINIADLFAAPNVTQQTVEMIRKAIGDAKEQKRDATILEIAYHTRFAVPAACAVFALTGAVFAVWSSRSGAFVGLLISMLVVMLYFNAYVISTQIIGPSRVLPPWLAAWLPDFVFFAVGLIALRRIE